MRRTRKWSERWLSGERGLPTNPDPGSGGVPGKNGWLEVRTRKESGRVGLKAKTAPDCRNLAGFAEIAVPVCNRGTKNLRLILRVDDDSTESLPTVQTRKGIFQVLISPGPEPMWLVVPLGDKKSYSAEDRFISMVGQPTDFVRRGSFNGANVTAISIFTPDPDTEHAFAIGPVIARGVPVPFRDWPATGCFRW